VINLIRGHGRRSRRSNSKLSSWHTTPVRNQQDTCENSCLRIQASTCASFKYGSRIGKKNWMIGLIGIPSSFFCVEILYITIRRTMYVLFDTTQTRIKFGRNGVRLNASFKITPCINSNCDAIYC